MVVDLPPRPRVLAAVLLNAAVGVAGSAMATTGPRHPVEDEPVLAAADLVQRSLLSGPGYIVDGEAPMVGFMARFRLDTDAGPLVADSVELLEVRATEMAAIAILDRTDLAEAFGIAARESVEGSVDTVLQVARQPLRTLAGLPGGVLRYFRAQADKWGGRVQRHGDRIGTRVAHVGDPYDMIGPMNAGRDERSAPRPKRRWWQRLGREGTRLVKDQAGYGRARRELARELGIDPYAATANPALNARLDRLAWAATSGSFAIGETLGRLPAAGRAVLSHSGRLNELVWDLAPEDLRRRNAAILERWCADPLQVRQFVRQRHFLASVQTRLADALDALAPAAGCEHLLDLALSAEHEVEARFLANALAMSADHLGEAARGARLDGVGAGLVLTLADGRRVLPLPVDHLSWSQPARDFFAERDLGDGDRLLLVAGTVSDRALRELTALGWHIVARTPYAAAPPYASGCCG